MFSESQPERNARRRAADGSPPLLRPCTMQARDERAVCEAERASSRGGRGDGQPVQRSKPRVGHGVGGWLDELGLREVLTAASFGKLDVKCASTFWRHR